METFFVSAGASLLAEFGDKTQLLAIVMVVAFRRQWPILLACLVAVLLNHVAAVSIGQWLVQSVGPLALRWGVGVLFLGTMGWLLKPDIADDALLEVSTGVMLPTALLGFFIAEFGDKSEVVATGVAVAGGQTIQAILGSSLGVLLAATPAVLLGGRLAAKVSMRTLHRIAAGTFGFAGVAVLASPSLFR